MAKLIIIAGIKRSGSTWVYNAVRLCLEHAGYSVHIAGDGQYYQKDCKADYQIIKVHPFHQWMADEADFVFTSDRDDDGIRASWQKFDGRMLSDGLLEKWNRWLRSWNEYSCREMCYEDFIEDGPFDEVFTIWWHLFPKRRDEADTTASKVVNKLNAIKPPTDKDYDPVTLLFSNHITS